MDAVQKDALVEVVFEEVHRAMGHLSYGIGRRLQDAGLLGDPEVSWAVSNELRRMLVTVADSPEEFSVHADWFTLGHVINAS